MAPTLTYLELDILRKLVNGEAVSLSSHLRLRLEMAGVLRDGARGIVVTDAGRRLAQQRPGGGGRPPRRRVRATAFPPQVHFLTIAPTPRRQAGPARASRPARAASASAPRRAP